VVLSDGRDEAVALVADVGVTAVTEILCKPIRIGPITIRDAQDGARGAGDTCLDKRTVDSEFRTVCALGNGLNKD
jgi:hypothetical protein